MLEKTADPQQSEAQQSHQTALCSFICQKGSSAA
jgi:hypothetical protein